MIKNTVLCLAAMAMFVPSFAMAEESAEKGEKDLPVPSVEEKIISSAFASFQAAMAYNEHCNGVDPKDTLDMEKKENAARMGNQQLLASRLGGLQQHLHPDVPQEQIVKKMVGFSRMIKDKTKERLKEKGCDGEGGESLKTVLSLYTQAVPAQVNQMLNQQIVEAGGTVTEIE